MSDNNDWLDKKLDDIMKPKVLITGASFHRGKSKQDYSTPDDFWQALTMKFGMPYWDLAASETNTKCPNWIDEGRNSLTVNWSLFMFSFLNPPFSNIEPWAAKCRMESETGAYILFLVPASVGSRWFQDHVHDHAKVYFLSPRLCFDGKAPFPKDCVLAEYGPKVKPSYECWRWK